MVHVKLLEEHCTPNQHTTGGSNYYNSHQINLAQSKSQELTNHPKHNLKCDPCKLIKQKETSGDSTSTLRSMYTCFRLQGVGGGIQL